MPRGLVVKNDSKMRGSTSGGMPGPLSSTSTTTYVALVEAAHAHAGCAWRSASSSAWAAFEDQVQEHLPEARPRSPRTGRVAPQVALDAARGT